MKLNWDNCVKNETPALLVTHKEESERDNLIPLYCQKFEAVGVAKQLLMTAPLANLYKMKTAKVVDLDLEYGYYSDRGGEEGDQYDKNVSYGFYSDILPDVRNARKSQTVKCCKITYNGATEFYYPNLNKLPSNYIFARNCELPIFIWVRETFDTLLIDDLYCWWERFGWYDDEINVERLERIVHKVIDKDINKLVINTKNSTIKLESVDLPPLLPKNILEENDLSDEKLNDIFVNGAALVTYIE